MKGVYTWTWNKNLTLWKNFIKWLSRQWFQTILKWKSRVNRLKWVKPTRALDQTSAGHRPQFSRTARAGTVLFCGGLLLVTSTLNPLITMNRKMKFWVNEGFQVIKVNWIGVSPRSTCWLIQFRLRSVTHALPSLIKILRSYQKLTFFQTILFVLVFSSWKFDNFWYFFSNFSIFFTKNFKKRLVN